MKPASFNSTPEFQHLVLSVSVSVQHIVSMDALLRSHHELRAAVRLAGKKIVQLNFGQRTDPVVEFLRRTLRDARILAKGL